MKHLTRSNEIAAEEAIFADTRAVFLDESKGPNAYKAAYIAAPIVPIEERPGVAWVGGPELQKVNYNGEYWKLLKHFDGY